MMKSCEHQSDCTLVSELVVNFADAHRQWLSSIDSRTTIIWAFVLCILRECRCIDSSVSGGQMHSMGPLRQAAGA
jgi:hypothetical protein